MLHNFFNWILFLVSNSEIKKCCHGDNFRNLEKRKPERRGEEEKRKPFRL